MQRVEITVQSLSVFRQETLEKKQVVSNAEVILKKYEENELAIENYHGTLEKQLKKAKLFYDNIDIFEIWYPKVEEQIQTKEESSQDHGALKTRLAKLEVCFYF